MLEQEYLPNAEKISDLRLEGKIAVSPFASYALGSLFMLIALVLQVDQLAGFFRKIFTLDKLRVSDLHDFSIFLIAPLLLFVTGVFLCHLLQSKFYFMPNLLSADFTRLFQFCRLSLSNMLWRVIYQLVVLFTFLIFAGVIYYTLALNCFAILKQSPGDVAAYVYIVLAKFLPIIGFLVFLSALISWLCSKYMFILKHRMTKAEKDSYERGGI